MPYTPPQEILDRYASVLVDFALGGGTGVHVGLPGPGPLRLRWRFPGGDARDKEWKLTGPTRNIVIGP